MTSFKKIKEGEYISTHPASVRFYNGISFKEYQDYQGIVKIFIEKDEYNDKNIYSVNVSVINGKSNPSRGTIVSNTKAKAIKELSRYIKYSKTGYIVDPRYFFNEGLYALVN
jgi:hypothetical protein